MSQANKTAELKLRPAFAAGSVGMPTRWAKKKSTTMMAPIGASTEG